MTHDSCTYNERTGNDYDQLWRYLMNINHSQKANTSKASEQNHPITWIAQWIDPEKKTEPEIRKAAGYLRRVFSLSGLDGSAQDATTEGAATANATTADAFHAVLYCTAHGLYRVYINGRMVGNDLFTPGCDEYGKRLCYQAYDVRQYLKNGENEIRVILGDRWYRGCNGIDGSAIFSRGSVVSLDNLK